MIWSLGFHPVEQKCILSLHFSILFSLFLHGSPSITRIALQGAMSNFKTLLKKKLSKIYMFIYNKNKYVKLIELGWES